MSILVTRSSMPDIEEYMDEIKPIFESHWMTNMGPVYKKFQRQLIDYLQVPEMSLFVNGHMALEMAIDAFGLREKGGEVITTPYTFVSTAHAIIRNNLKPVFCDIKPDDFITTNGIFGHLDSHRMCAESLDFMTYDSYPNFAYCLDDYGNDLLGERRWSRNLSLTRSISSVFGIMEQQSGANGWNTRMLAPTPRPGQMTLWAMQSIAHGADFVSFFRWRTATVGTEMYWHGILDYSGRANRRLTEVTQIGEKLSRMQEIAGSTYEARVGIVEDYDNIWDAELDKWHELVHEKSREGLFAAAQLLHAPVDFVYLRDETSAEELKGYRLLFYPHGSILTEERTALLEEYVASGGVLVMGCRTGYKDTNGRCVRDRLPGLAAKLTGTDIPEYSLVAPDEGPIKAEWDGESIEAAVFTDMLRPLGDARVLASYENGCFAGEAALIDHSFGAGRAYYFGGAFSPDTAQVFLRRLGEAEPYGELIELPACCELAVRRKGDVRYLFVLNYGSAPCTVRLHKPVTELLSGAHAVGEVTVEKYGVRIYRTGQMPDMEG